MDLIYLRSSQYLILFKMDGCQSQFLVITQKTQFVKMAIIPISNKNRSRPMIMYTELSVSVTVTH